MVLGRGLPRGTPEAMCWSSFLPELLRSQLCCPSQDYRWFFRSQTPSREKRAESHGDLTPPRGQCQEQSASFGAEVPVLRCSQTKGRLMHHKDLPPELTEREPSPGAKCNPGLGRIHHPRLHLLLQQGSALRRPQDPPIHVWPRP
ncbi:small integral membrane protein 47 isoform X2 [Loxodonta africana]|uniref:small integral membrane protein 47 isoform X2 n=1 Tax=Loxodonta africana TaxID=9785 RepID=UPI0030D3B605